MRRDQLLTIKNSTKYHKLGHIELNNQQITLIPFGYSHKRSQSSKISPHAQLRRKETLQQDYRNTPAKK